jgi:hypothetical protein
MGQMARGASGTRAFVAGEKLWVTDVEVKPKGIVFWLLSDQYSGIRYRASVNFPFEKGGPPSAADAMAVVGEVFDVEGSPIAPADGRSVTAAPPPAGHQQPDAQAGPVPVQEIKDWDSRYGRITNDDLERIKDPTVRFDLNYLRLNPAALDQKPVMQYFVALNNCNQHDVERALFNELDYPALAAFYKSKAAQILAPLPRTITDVSFDRFIGGYQQGNWRLWSQSLSLGEYDPQRKAFPLKYPGKDMVEIPEALSTDSNRNPGQTCPAAQKTAGAAHSFLPLKYEIAVRPAAYRELRMDEASARQYIDSAGQQRAVFLAVDVAILDSAPNVDRGKDFVAKATFRAQVLRLRVIDSRTQKPLGALFDDGSLRAEAQVVQTPPAPAAPAPKSGSGNWAASDHMYDIRMSVYVSLAADACGWPLTDEQSTNLKRFLDQVSNRGNFNEKYQYNLAHTRIKNSISAQGRMNYCANPAERKDFDKYAAMVAPLGPLAASGANLQ